VDHLDDLTKVLIRKRSLQRSMTLGKDQAVLRLSFKLLIIHLKTVWRAGYCLRVLLTQSRIVKPLFCSQNLVAIALKLK
jgi:hypothetical protein